MNWLGTRAESLDECVSPGGVIQIDDYGHWEGARKAVDEFLQRRGIDVALRWVDYSGRQLIKRASENDTWRSALGSRFEAVGKSN